MGLFSEKRTYVFTSVQKALDEESIPDSLKQALVYALHGDADILESIQSHFVNSIGMNLNKLYKKSESKNVIGNPSGEFVSNHVAFRDIQDIIRQETGQPTATVHYAKYGKTNLVHFAWKRIVEEFGFYTPTFELKHIRPGNPDLNKWKAYLRKVQITLPGAVYNRYESWANPVSELVDNLQVYEGNPLMRVYNSGLFLNTEVDRIVENGVFGAAFALPGSNTPEYSIGGIAGSFDNIIFFRDYFALDPNWARLGNTEIELVLAYDWRHDDTLQQGGMNFWSEELRREYLENDLSGEKIIRIPLQAWNMEFDCFHAKYSIGGQEYYWIYKEGAGTYPVLDTYFESGKQNELFGEFFPNIYFRLDKRPLKDSKPRDWLKSSRMLMDTLGMDYDTIHDDINSDGEIGDVEQAYMTFAVPPVSDNDIENKYLFDFFDKLRTFQDNVSDIQPAYDPATKIWFVNDFRDKNAIFIKDAAFEYAVTNKGIFKSTQLGTIGGIGKCTSQAETEIRYLPGYDEDGNYVQHSYPIKRYVYRKQIGTNVYEEIEVYELQTRYNIDGYKWTVGDIDKQEEITLIPIEHGLINLYPVSQREELFSRSAHFVFNSRIVVKSKWYETAFFSWVVMVVTAAFGGYKLGPLLSGINSGLAAGTTSVIQAITTLAWNVVIKGMAISLAIKLVVNAIGIEAAVVAAVLIAAYAFTKGGFSIESLNITADIKDLLSVSLGLVQSAGESLKDAVKLIGEEITEFGEWAKAQWELLEEADALLKPTSILSPFTYLGESAEAFYNRTVHSGNVGILAIDAQSDFVERALRLPTIQDTLGSYDYAV